MMSYSNKYDAIPICRRHARTEPVRTPKFSSDNACDKIVACRTHARVVASCAFTPLVSPTHLNFTDRQTDQALSKISMLIQIRRLSVIYIIYTRINVSAFIIGRYQ